MLKYFKKLFKAIELKPGAFGISLNLKALFGAPKGVAQETYKALIMDLKSTEKALRGFSETHHSPDTLQLQIRDIIKATEPVCAVKAKLAEIDDADTRIEIDLICSSVEAFKNIVDPDFKKEEKFMTRALMANSMALGLATTVSKLSHRLTSR